MQILLAFLPFIVFAVVDRLAGPVKGLVAGALVSLLLLGRDWLINKHLPKILDLGSALLFSGLVLYSFFEKRIWSVIGVRFCVDIGLLVIVLASMAVGRPFTMQYAREQVNPELWNTSEFRRINYMISGVWALAFAVMVITELALLYSPNLPPRVGIIVIILALVGAVKFTGWYPNRAKS